jgi:SAM-dependent methyltransferase
MTVPWTGAPRRRRRAWQQRIITAVRHRLHHLMPHDDWLDPWLPELTARAAGAPVLEIGCGSGDDTATLAAAGLAVVAFDLSPEAVATARARVPQAAVSCQDVRDPFPLAPGSAGAVVASLSLHYFPWDETVGLARRIHAVLRPGGLLLCRLNSTEDTHFGAQGHPRIDDDFYLVNGEPKRFFDAAAIDRLFADGWQRLSTRHAVTGKYGLPKSLWEVALLREGGDGAAEAAPAS